MRGTIKPVLLASLVVAVSGCATQKHLTRDEYLQTTQRTYANKTPDDILRAAEKLFFLADGDDFTFHHTDDALVASRKWTVYLVLAASMGTDTWVINTDEQGGATKVSAMVSTQGGAVTPMPTTGGDWTAGSMPAGAYITQGTAIYDVFWARMDYLLGETDKWMTCKEADLRVKEGVVWGSNEALCNSFNLKDSLPEELRPGE